MTPADAAELLTIAAAFDRRKIGKADAIAWADALQGLAPGDCAVAIRAHFRESGEYLMPIHVRKGVQRIRAERIDRAIIDVPDADANPDDVNLWLESVRAENNRIADGGPAHPTQLHPKRPVAELLGDTAAQMPHVQGSSEIARKAFDKALRAKKMCACGHTRSSHSPDGCVGCTGPDCDEPQEAS